VVIEQLAELLAEPMPDHLTDATRDQCFLDLLDRAATASEAQGERLVLLIDGLDEDRGVTTRPDAHSIAALLPVRPPTALRVIVTGRPNPPIPTDVPDGHPLRDPAAVRLLTTSLRAQVVRQDGQRELKRLLQGTSTEQDLLGLLTAEGGLSAFDLAELTGRSTWDVNEHLIAVTGRTFMPFVGRWRPDTTVYMLGHEELQEQATVFLGPTRLGDYRQRLHTWADHYRDQSWPVDTPEYLLRDYYPLLRAINDLPGCWHALPTPIATTGCSIPRATTTSPLASHCTALAQRYQYPS
jgi:hypothetical protein